MIELQAEIDEFTIVVGNVNAPLSEMDRSSRQKISNDMVEPNSTTSQADRIDIYGVHQARLIGTAQLDCPFLKYISSPSRVTNCRFARNLGLPAPPSVRTVKTHQL
jgi:hypothetical protein